MQIQKFGIEIRKIGNIESLYKEVDLVLNKIGCDNGVSAIIQKQTVAHALQKMITTQEYFDVCTIRNCAEMCQMRIPKERMDVYSSIHCLYWNQMLPEYRQSIVAMVLDDFRVILS